MRRQKIYYFILCMSMTFFAGSLWGFEIKFLDKFELSQEKELIAYPMALCVTEDDLFLVSDMKLAHVKVFDNKGNLLKILGRQGFGPNEFTRATYSFYEDGKFGVYDMDAWRVHLYEREGKLDFKRINSILSHTAITDAHLKSNKIYIAGYRIGNDNNEYEFFSIDIKTGKSEFLMPVYYAYGFASYSEYKINKESPVIAMVGGMNKFDIAGNFAYYIWEGNLSIIRIPLSGGKITCFGHKTDNYIPPFISNEILKTIDLRYGKASAYGKARGKMSFVDKIFAGRDYVMVIYRGPTRNETLLPYTAQFYTLDGEFINEVRLPALSYKTPFFLDKEENILYSVAAGDKEEDEEDYYIIKMQVSKGNPK
ncbi:MAG: hypothetical protein QG657_4812 [Acidobacteriota bacterium]|nr:hypothetical protein [Acidobacteriota bacterium]